MHYSQTVAGQVDYVVTASFGAGNNIFAEGLNMKTNMKYLLWFVVTAMFCAAISAGCGGSSSNSGDSEPAAQDEGTATDDYTDRGTLIGYAEMINFNAFSGAWEVFNVTMLVGDNYVLTPKQDLYTTRFKVKTSYFQKNDNLATTTLNFDNAEGQTVLHNIFVLAGGRFESTDKDYIFRTKDDDGVYYEIQGRDADNYPSSPWEYLYFRTYYKTGGDTSIVQTSLRKIPDDTVEDLSLVAGDWKIVSASLQVRGSKSTYVLNDWDEDYSPNVTLIKRNDDGLYWTYDRSMGLSYTPLELEFVDDTFMSTIVNLLNIMDGYKRYTSNLFETPRKDSTGKTIDFQRIDGGGLIPWEKITLSRYYYNENIAGQLDTIVKAVLQRRK